jgi:hypothetical protein
MFQKRTSTFMHYVTLAHTYITRAHLLRVTRTAQTATHLHAHTIDAGNSLRIVAKRIE